MFCSPFKAFFSSVSIVGAPSPYVAIHLLPDINAVSTLLTPVGPAGCSFEYNATLN
jgi:hypothetical protein